MNFPWLLGAVALVSASAMAGAGTAAAQEANWPNIVVIMGDDIGWSNIGVYNQGIMAGRTPNLDQLANEGMRFTEYYAEASCTAGRANFITGELPIRTGMTTVGQAGSPIGIPAEAITIATALKAQGYATGQFGKNHLGDLNEFLPTVHGFDEFFGYLYHLDAMEDPAHRNYPQNLIDQVGPRNMVHSWATDTDDATVQPRWGKIGKQRIEDAGPLYPERMKTVDDEILADALKFTDKARGREAVLPLAQPDPDARRHPSLRQVRGDAHARERLEHPGSRHGAARRRGRLGDGLPEGQWPRGEHDRRVHDRNGAENFTWPDGGQTPFAGGKGTALEGGFRVPAIIRWPGKVPAGKVENGIFSGLDWFPTLVAAAGDPEHHRRAAQGQADRRPDVQGASRRLRPDGRDHR